MVIEINSFVVLIVMVVYVIRIAISIYNHHTPTLMEAAILYIEVLVLAVAIGVLSLGIPIRIG